MLDSQSIPSWSRHAGRVDLRHLRSAVAAADHGSLRRAADLLCVQQSTLSRSIAQLEHAVGTRLFERSTGGVQPTTAGQIVLRKARIILEELDNLVATTRSGQAGTSASLSIGFSTSLSAGNLRATLVDFRHRLPETEIVTFERPRSRLSTSLRNHAVDILLIAGDETIPDGKSMALWSERILVILPKDHPLAGREVIYWTDLRNETLLLSRDDPGRELGNLLNSKLVSSGDRPRVERHDVSRGIIKSLSAMGFGIGLALESDLGANFSTLAYRELRDGTGPTRLGFSAYWRGDNENPALRSFLELLSERYPSPDACG